MDLALYSDEIHGSCLRLSASRNYRKNIRCMVAIDMSSSVCNSMVLVKNAVKYMVSELIDGDIIGILSFDRVCVLNVELMKFKTSDRNFLYDSIDSIECNTKTKGTNISNALRVAFRQFDTLEDTIYSSIMLFSDGIENISRSCFSPKRPDIQINTYAVGNDVNSECLDRIARSCTNKGKFTLFTNISQIHNDIASLWHSNAIDIIVTIKSQSKIACKDVRNMYQYSNNELKFFIGTLSFGKAICLAFSTMGNFKITVCYFDKMKNHLSEKCVYTKDSIQDKNKIIKYKCKLEVMNSIYAALMQTTSMAERTLQQTARYVQLIDPDCEDLLIIINECIKSIKKRDAPYVRTILNMMY